MPKKKKPKIPIFAINPANGRVPSSELAKDGPRDGKLLDRGSWISEIERERRDAGVHPLRSSFSRLYSQALPPD